MKFTYGDFREGDTADGLPGRAGRLDGLSTMEVRTMQGVSVYLVQTRVEVEVVHSMIVCRVGLTGMINDKVIICCRRPPSFGSKSSAV